MGARNHGLVLTFVMLSMLLPGNMSQAGGSSDFPTCRSNQAVELLPALYDHWLKSSDEQKSDAALELSQCLIESGFLHGATYVLGETVQAVGADFHSDLSRVWLPLEIKIGPDTQQAGQLSQHPLLNVHRRERSHYAFIQGLSRYESGSFAAAIQDLSRVSGAERGAARLLLGHALHETHAFSDALAAYHGALGSLGDAKTDHADLLNRDASQYLKKVKAFQNLADDQGVTSFQLPTEVAPLASEWIVPNPHAQAKMGLGHAALALKEPDAARSYFSTLFDHPTFGSEAKLSAGQAALSGFSIATALSYLEPLSRETNLSALHAQLLLREMTPEKKAQGVLYERSRSLYSRLESEILPLKELLEQAPETGLELLKQQALKGSGPYPEVLLNRLQNNTSLHLARRRLKQVELEWLGLNALGESTKSSPLGQAIWATLRRDQQRLTEQCNQLIQQDLNRLYSELLDAKKQIPPSDIRDALFTPLYILAPSN